MTKQRIRFVQGPPIRERKELPAAPKLPVPVAKTSLQLPSVQTKRNETSSRFSVYSYFQQEDDEPNTLRDRRKAKSHFSSNRSQQQFDLSSPNSKREERQVGRERNDSLSMSLESSSSSVMLVSGANQMAFNDSVVDESRVLLGRSKSDVSISQADLNNILRMWDIETRSRGSEVGASKLGRELQKLYPSEVLPMPGDDADFDLAVKAHASQMGDPSSTVEQVEQAEQKQPHTNNEPLPAITAQYATLSKWQIGTNRPVAQMAHFTAVNAITLREAALMRLISVVNKLDSYYWQYSVARLKAASLKMPIKTLSLIKMRRKMVAYQDECRVAIAHYRGATIQVVLDIQKWKNICQQESQTQDSAELLWNGVNYFEKMLLDVNNLYALTVTRLWLNILPTTFMVPLTPQCVFDYSRLQSVGKDYSALNSVLLDVIAKLQQRDAVILRDQTANFMRTGELQVVVGVGEDGLGADEDGASPELGAGAAKSEGEQEGKNMEDPKEDEEQENEPAEGNECDEKEHMPEEWQVLRDYCVQTWGWGNSNVTPEFSEAMLANMNSLVVQCYLGLPEVYPKAPLVPSLPDSLLDKCTRLASAMKRELKVIENVKVKERMGIQLRQQLESDLLSNKNLLNQPDSQDASSKHLLLRQRQEGGSAFLRSSSTVMTLSAADFFAMTATNDSAVGFEQHKTHTNGFSRDNTSAAYPVSISSSQRQQTAPFESLFYQTGDGRSGTSGALPKLNAKQIQKQLEERVSDQRQIIELNGAVKSKRESVPTKLPEHTKTMWRNAACVKIQKIVRAFFGRRRFRMCNRNRVLTRAATRIQAHWRGIWGRVRFKNCLRKFRIKSLRHRKIITNQDDSALKITHFIRYLGESNVIGEEEAAAKSPLFAKKNPMGENGVYKSLSRESPKKRKENLLDVIDREMLKPYLMDYHDHANIIRDPSVSTQRTPNLSSQLDTRLNSRLIPRGNKGQAKPFSARGRLFAEQLVAANQRTVAKSLSERPNDIYLVPPSLATESEKVVIFEAIMKGRRGGSRGMNETPLDLRAVLLDK